MVGGTGFPSRCRGTEAAWFDADARLRRYGGWGHAVPRGLGGVRCGARSGRFGEESRAAEGGDLRSPPSDRSVSCFPLPRLSGRTGDHGGRCCDLGAEIFHAAPWISGTVPLTVVSLSRLLRVGDSQRLMRLRTAGTARPRRTGSAMWEAISV